MDLPMKEPDSCFRHDLGSCAGADEDNVSAKEFMPQIMWPSLYLKGGVEDSEVHQRIIQLARQGQISLEPANRESFIDQSTSMGDVFPQISTAIFGV